MRARLVAVVAAVLVMTGCSQLPDSGSVHTDAQRPSSQQSQAPYFRPPGPSVGADPQSIVRGFLTAMEANPFSVAASRSFLTPEAAEAWRPNNGTIVYQTARFSGSGADVGVQLSEAHTLDVRGAWARGGAAQRRLAFHLVKVQGEWRIADAPDRLVVSDSFFATQFQPFSLYFYDRSGQSLVPDLVHLQRGEQTATALVRGLLRGPRADRQADVRTALPDTELDLAVVITDSGTAEVPLGPEMLRLSPDQLVAAMRQLGMTLASVPGVTRVRVTVAGAPLPLPDGRTELPVDEAAEYADPTRGLSRDELGVRDGRVVVLDGTAQTPVRGAFGRAGYVLRSLAVTRSGDTLAGVSQSGTRVYVAGTDAGAVRTVFTRGSDLARPTYDFFGRLWLLDRTPAGAVIHLLTGSRDRVVDVPGVSGEAVSSIRISPDGTRLAVAYTGGAGPRVSVASVERSRSGGVVAVARALPVSVADAEPDHRLGPALDVGWSSASTLAVLTDQVDGVSRVVQLPYDGSPGGDLSSPEVFTGHASQLLVNGDPVMPMALLDDSGVLHRMQASGAWQVATKGRLDAVAAAD